MSRPCGRPSGVPSHVPIASTSPRCVATRAVASSAKTAPYPPPGLSLPTDAPTDVLYDAVIVGGGMGGLTTAAKLVEKGAKVRTCSAPC